MFEYLSVVNNPPPSNIVIILHIEGFPDLKFEELEAAVVCNQLTPDRLAMVETAKGRSKPARLTVR